MLNIGDKIPSFSVQNQKGEKVDQEAFEGKKVVLWFYPKADTPGCTIEGCSFRDGFQILKDAGLTIFGASFDSPGDNKAFKEKHEFPFDLLSDMSREFGVALGAADELAASHAKRITYVFDNGVVVQSYPEVDPKSHYEQILSDLNIEFEPKKEPGIDDVLAAGIDDLRQSLTSLREEVKLKLHLGSMEAKNAFEKIEPAIDKAGADLKRATESLQNAAAQNKDEAELNAHLAFMEAKERWTAISGDVARVSRDLRRDVSDSLLGKYDEAKLKTHLANMDAEDKIKERATAFTSRYSEAKDAVKKEATQSVASLKSSISELLKGVTQTRS